MNTPIEMMLATNPVKLFRDLWPQHHIYDKQQQILYSVRDDNETYVPAANKVGKDFIGGAAAVINFVTAKKLGLSCRIVTTSVKDRHLDVLWGEIGRFIGTSRVPLLVEQGGPLRLMDKEIRWEVDGKRDLFSYVQGMVSKEVEGLTGHHADWTVCIIDECSGVDHEVYDNVRTWAQRLLAIGNCQPCARDHFFRSSVREGNKVRPTISLNDVLKP